MYKVESIYKILWKNRSVWNNCCVKYVQIYYTKPSITGTKYIAVEVVLNNDSKSKNLLQKILIWSSDIYALWGNLLDHKLPSGKMYIIYYLT